MPAARPRPNEDIQADPLQRCQARIGHRFNDPSILRAALTHASGADHRLESNERLEFLGDSILGAVVCELLYRNYPESQEGELTRIKSHVVSRRMCAKLTRSLGLDEFLILGKGMGGHVTPSSVLADVFESLVGAIFIDGGMTAARRFLTRQLTPEIEAAVAEVGSSNHKSQLQQLAQKLYGATPTYALLDEKGPDHSKCFKIAARIGADIYAPAWGPTKKDAEQRAAQNALSQIQGDALPHPSD
jgi:ribonuclease-3